MSVLRNVHAPYSAGRMSLQVYLARRLSDLYGNDAASRGNHDDTPPVILDVDGGVEPVIELRSLHVSDLCAVVRPGSAPWRRWRMECTLTRYAGTLTADERLRILPILRPVVALAASLDCRLRLASVALHHVHAQPLWVWLLCHLVDPATGHERRALPTSRTCDAGAYLEVIFGERAPTAFHVVVARIEALVVLHTMLVLVGWTGNNVRIEIVRETDDGTIVRLSSSDVATCREIIVADDSGLVVRHVPGTHRDLGLSSLGSDPGGRPPASVRSTSSRGTTVPDVIGGRWCSAAGAIRVCGTGSPFGVKKKRSGRRATRRGYPDRAGPPRTCGGRARC